MKTLDQFIEKHPVSEEFTLVRINEDIAIAWIPHDYVLRRNDICYLPEKLVVLLVKRGTALEIKRKEKTSKEGDVDD